MEIIKYNLGLPLLALVLGVIVIGCGADSGNFNPIDETEDVETGTLVGEITRGSPITRRGR